MADRQDVESVLTEFRDRNKTLESLCAKTKALIEQSLEDAGVKCQSVQARVKTEKKLRTKYQDPTKAYSQLDDITDQAGLRVITYYEDEVDKVANVINAQFDIDPDKSVDKRKTEPDRFGYYALHFVCTHLKRRTDDVEYKRFSGLSFEIQITPILQHAWAEIEHEWYDLKAAFPEDIKRRFSRISAVLEVAGSEFTEIKKQRDNYTRAVELQVETNVDVPLDAISLRSLLAEPWVGIVDDEVAALSGWSSTKKTNEALNSLVLRFLKFAGLLTVEEVRKSSAAYRESTKAFATEFLTLLTSEAKNVDIGESLFYLALMLLAAKGEAALSEALRKLTITTAWSPAVVAAMAKRALVRRA
jgi:ppGpp synthetase/RelA/SpoT-type nucleotidyltranferase